MSLWKIQRFHLWRQSLPVYLPLLCFWGVSSSPPALLNYPWPSLRAIAVVRACLHLAGQALSPPPPGSFRNHHTMPFSSSRGSKAWSGGTLVTGNYQLAQMKWLLERPLKTHRATRSLRHPLAIHLIPPPSLALARAYLKKKKK